MRFSYRSYLEGVFWAATVGLFVSAAFSDDRYLPLIMAAFAVVAAGFLSLGGER